MGASINHHFVPQFFFRLFTGGERHICAFVTKHRKVVRRAPIKGQCARHKFYGTAEVESALAQIEGLHAAALRRLVARARANDRSLATFDDDSPWIVQAVAFQRARTTLEVEKMTPARLDLVAQMFRAHVSQTNELTPERRDRLLNAIDCGDFQLSQEPASAVALQIKTALECAAWLADLTLRIIRNQTDYPFVFSDAPVVFYNSLYRRITDRGVLGYQTPGLQIFYPLTPKLQLMLIDAKEYSGSFRQGPFCDVTERRDVSNLNALQIHHSHSTIYFASPEDADYVSELHNTHAALVNRPRAELHVRSDWRVDGEVSDLPLMHTFEPQLNHALGLTFVDCNPVEPKDFVFRRRSPDVTFDDEDGSE